MKRLLLTALAFTVLTGGLAFGSKTEKLVLTKSNTIVLRDSVNPESVAAVQMAAIEMSANSTTADGPIILVLDTPGGSVEDGLQLIEVLKGLNREVVTLSLFSASMGFQTVQQMGKRYITNSGILMSHKARGGFSGEFPGQLDSRYEFYKKRIRNLNEDAAARTGGKYSLEAYEALIENEYWCSGNDCVSSGFADAVAVASCGADLSGTSIVTNALNFFGKNVEVDFKQSDCPLVTGVAVAEVRVNGKRTLLSILERLDAQLHEFLTRAVTSLNSRPTILKREED